MIYQLNSDYYVRMLRDEDLLGPYPSWFEDQEVCLFNSHGKFFKTQDDFHTYLDSLSGEDQVVWAICHTTDGHIGNVSLQGISFIHRHADFGIIIGDKNHWGRGVAFLATKALFRHGFNKLNLERIWCSAAFPNLAMRKLAKRLGMVEEGCRRAHLYLNGEWVDMVEFGLLRCECEFLTSAG